MTIDIDIDFEGLEKLSAWQAATAQQLQLAAARASRKTMRWVKTRVLQHISRAVKIPQKVLRPRLQVYATRNADYLEARLWVGLYNIPLFKAARGQARQTRKGARALRQIWPHSFIAVMRDGNAHKGIFFRKSRQRLPIKEKTINISRATEQKIRQLIEGPVQRYWQKTFKHELNYAMGRV